MFWVSYVLLWVIAAFQLVAIAVVAQRLFQQAREPDSALATIGPLPAGAVAPTFSAVRLGSAIPVRSMELHGAEMFMLFLSVDCPDCRRIIAGLQETRPALLDGLVIHCIGNASECERRFAALPRAIPVLMNGETDVGKAFGLSGVPTGVTIDSEWRIREFHYPTSAGAVLETLRTLARSISTLPYAFSANWK